MGISKFRSLALAIVMLSAASAYPQVFGTVRVNLRDPQNLPVANATVVVAAEGSTYSQTLKTNTVGDAVFPTIPAGRYHVTATAEGFEPASTAVGVLSNSVTPVQLALAVAGLAQSVDVVTTIETVNPETSKTATLVERDDIGLQPGADRSGSLSMITDNVPGTYVMHDHLHSRGGHGVTWEVDGVPVPNSNLASVGAQFDPKDVESLEVNRGGLSANYGDRSYGVFNVVPRSGFEATRFGDAALTVGNYNHVNGYLGLGSHSNDQQLAWFASGTVNRTDLGLERVDIPVLHDDAVSSSGFGSMIFNASPTDQIRFVGSARTDHYQVPNIQAQQDLGINDREVATDGFANLTWGHTFTSGALLTVSPYYHFNRGQYIGGANDPVVTNDDRTSHYAGGYVNLAITAGKHTLRVGTDTFAEHDDSLFGLASTGANVVSFTQRERLWASVFSLFADDTYRVASHLTINPGVRFERFAGTLTESATSPRLGAALTVPHIGVLRASYSRYYQHPQTSTISGPLLEFAAREGFDFLPVPGERDQVWEVGLGIPIRGWTLDFDAFHNSTQNAVDHEVLGNSNLLLPLTIAEGRVRAFESTLRSPMIAKRLRVHYALSIQSAQGKGAITGGLTDFKPPPNAYFYLDHDQRVTFNAGAELSLPWDTWASGTALFGSGFLRGDGPAHMPRHTTADLAVGKNFGETFSLRLTALNVANALYLTGFENSFAGTHYASPREVSVQVRLKFHY
jgi:hypothetical protein